MISTKMEQALNDQINAEFYSAYLYLSMAAHFQSENLPGLANWMQVQQQEEVTHGMKMFNFVHERGGRVLLKAIEEPPTEWKSPLAAFQAAYEHEQKVTGRIHSLMDLAIKEKDHAAASFLKWFVDEQVEEEASADAIVKTLKATEKAPAALYMIDRELAQRKFKGDD